MKQTQTEHQEAGAEQTGPGQIEQRENAAMQRKSGQPQSWRAYIEQTMPTQEAAAKAVAQTQPQRRPRKSRGAKAAGEKAGALSTPVRETAARVKAQAEKGGNARAAGEKTGALSAPVRETAAKVEVQAEKGGNAKAAGEKAGALSAAAKETAAKAAKGGLKGLEAAWEKVSSLTAEGWDRMGQATGKVRSVVARHPISPLFYVTLVTVIVGAAIFNGSYTRAYAVSVNGQSLGVVSSPDEVDSIVSNVESRAADVLGESYDYDADIDTIPVYITPDELSDTTQIEDTLFEGVGAYMKAYAISVDGTELGRAATKDELYQMLDEVAQPYIPEDAIRYEFMEDVQVYPIEVPANTQFDTQAVRETLSALEIEQATYEVKKGDTFNAIAYSLDMWPNDLSVLNPDVIVDKLWVGQELVIQQAVPYLSVKVTTDETYEEVITSPVEYIETADLYVGDTKVKEQGEDGLALVNAQVIYVNGVEMGRNVISTTTLQEATTTYTYTGTAPRPVTASNGYFIWPVRGTITSNFGGRNLWGSYDFHLGLDIACRTGTGIKAADGGTVIKAGWSGSYGYLVAIRHDNGIVTYYAHNSSILVSVGQKVYQGQIIAKAGMTGNASGPHCHFEVRVNGTSVNPRNYL